MTTRSPSGSAVLRVALALTLAAGCGPKKDPIGDRTTRDTDSIGAPVGGAATEKDGVRVVVLPSSAPVVSFRISFRAGSADDPAGKEGLTYLLGRTMAEGGTESMTYKELLDKLYPWAAGISVQVDREQLTFVARCHRDHLEAFYPILRDVLLRPRLGEKDFARLRDEALNKLTREIRTSNDEELSKAVLEWTLFAGHEYRHLPIGTEAGLKAIALKDLAAHRKRVLTRDRLFIGVSGAVTASFAERVRSDLSEALPRGAPEATKAIAPSGKDGIRVVIVDKPEAKSTAISFGHRIEPNRAHRDFAALALAASYFGEHRQFHGVLFQSIREARGMNYGDYAYVEAFIQDGWTRFPRTNTARDLQYFSIWIRPVPSADRHFALRIAMWNLRNLLRDGISEEAFRTTREFLDGYLYLLEQTDMRRLGYAIDDAFYGLSTPHFSRLREAWKAMTAADVNTALRKHIHPEQLVIVIVTADAAGLKKALVAETPSPMKYASPKPKEVLAEDAVIEKLPLGIAAERVTIVPVGELFAR